MKYPYWWLVAWAHVCKWGWAGWRKIVTYWASTPERCRVYIGIMVIVVLLSLSLKAFAHHADPPYNPDRSTHFSMSGERGPIICELKSDSEGLHACWPMRFAPHGVVFGSHGWCVDASDDEQGDRWACGATKQGALSLKREVDGTSI
jgi:hypothetical protein